MYESFFGLREAPFSIAPNPHYLYMSRQHNEALAHLVYGVSSAGGFVLLTGEVGTGKTTVCRCFLEQVPEDTDVAFILNPKVSVEELLETICDELSIAYIGDKMTSKSYVDFINERLLRSHSKGRHTVLIIDEAQTMEPDVLEQLRLLTNLETNEKKLLQIVLLGQPELQELFCRQELRQLAQRVTARFHLDALKPEEIQPYVAHRMGVAGCTDAASIFPPASMKTIYAISKGIPRVINLICDRALLGAYSKSAKVVTPDILRVAAREVLGRTNPNANYVPWWRQLLEKKWFSTALLALLCGLSAGVGVGLVNYFMNSPDAATVQAHADRLRPTVAANPNSAVANPSALPSEPTAKPTPKVATPAKPQKTSLRIAEPVSVPLESDDSLNNPQGLNDIVDSGRASLQRFFSEFGNELNEATANRALMGVWGVEYVAQRDGRICGVAKVYGLACLNKIGDLDTLRHVGLPAVLTLYSPEGDKRYGFLRSLDDSTASFVVGEQQINIPVNELSSMWRGHYLLLWKVPPKYRGPLRPNTIGPMTKWLSAELDKYEGVPNPGAPKGNYDAKMVKRVKNFQKDVGETPDGIVGINTLIQLSKFNDADVPKLLRSEQERL